MIFNVNGRLIGLWIALLLSFGSLLLISDSAEGAVLGRKLEYISGSIDSALPPPMTEVPLSIESGGVIPFGPGETRSSDGKKLTYYWSARVGRLESLVPGHHQIRYVAPQTGVAAEDSLYLWIGSEGGKTREYLFNITITPTADSSLGIDPSVGGDLTASYVPASGTFDVSYRLGSDVRKAWISRSFDGRLWSNVDIIDPVTDSNRQGVRSVTVEGSDSRSLVHFRIYADIGLPKGVAGTPKEIAYAPATPGGKNLELPTAPTLSINGYETRAPHVRLGWSRINDRNNDDNVVFYEVEYATNRSFDNSTLLNIGNPATGGNMYERLSYTVTGLDDDHTYYFRVRGSNHVGAGSWSNVDNIRINIPDLPVFSQSNPIAPANGAQNVSKTPELRFSVYDPDGDPLDFAIYCGESPGQLSKIRGFGDWGEQGGMRFSPSEWREPLKPNTTYYWQVLAREVGHGIGYYDGTYPASPTWSFTTENSGSSLQIQQVTLIAGEVAPESTLTYRATIANQGNAASAPNTLKAAYLKNGSEWPFLHLVGGDIPALDPGQSAVTELSVRFRDTLWTSPMGTLYDNVLVSGASSIRFYLSRRDDQNTSTPTATVPVSYESEGPAIEHFLLRGYSGSNSTPRGTRLQIDAVVRDDIRTSSVRFEYRTSASGAWTFLDEYTGNVRPVMEFADASNGGDTDGSSGSVRWFVPYTVPITSAFAVRMTAWDDEGQQTSAISPNFSIYDGSVTVTVGATELDTYRVGDVVRFPVTAVVPGPIVSYKIELISSTGPENLITESGSVENPIELPEVLSVEIPPYDRYVLNGASIRVSVEASLPFGQVDGNDVTDNTFNLVAAEPPAPFDETIEMYPHRYSFPSGSIWREDLVEPVTLAWENDDRVHTVYRQWHYYNLNNTDHSGEADYHVVYDRLLDQVTTKGLPNNYQAVDSHWFGDRAYILAANGLNIYLFQDLGNSFTAPQYVGTVESVERAVPRLFEYGGELYFQYVANATQSSANRRNTFRRVAPSLGAPVQQALQYLGRRVHYGPYISSDRGVFNRNSDLTASSLLVGFSSNRYVFENSAGNLSGLRQAYENSTHVAYLYNHSGVATTIWNLNLNETYHRAFDDYLYAIGRGSSVVPGEDGKNVIVRRDRQTNEEHRYAIGTYDGLTDTLDRAAVSDGKWAALSWGRWLTVANLSGDIQAPVVVANDIPETFTPSHATSVLWSQADSGGSVVRESVGYWNSGSFVVLHETSGPDLSGNRSVDIQLPNLPSVLVRIESEDAHGNTGTYEQVIKRAAPISITVSASPLSVNAGDLVTVQWSASPNDPLRVYTVMVRRSGESVWAVAGQAIGDHYALDTSGFSGQYEVKVVAEGGQGVLSGTVEVTGDDLVFYPEEFVPSASTYWVAAANPTADLRWSTNQEVSSELAYEVQVRWDQAGDFQTIATTHEKGYRIATDGHSSIEWRVGAVWRGSEVISPSFAMTLESVGNANTPTLSLENVETEDPSVLISWEADGADEVVLYRLDTQSGDTIELARLLGDTESFRDDTVVHGGQYDYSIGLVVRGDVGEQGPSAAITVNTPLPLGIQFENTNYETVNNNEITVRWNPILPAGETVVFAAYEVILRRGGGAIVESEIAPAGGALLREMAYEGLAYGQSYVVEVFSLGPDGRHFNQTPVRHYFYTGPDNRQITERPVVQAIQDSGSIRLQWSAPPNADSYDVFRINGEGAQEWLARIEGTSFSDQSFTQSGAFSYIIRARNEFSFLDSLPTSSFNVVLPPRWISEPQDTIVLYGQSVTLMAEASGGASYQWFQGETGDASVPINEAVSTSFTTPPLTEDASYWVRAMNSDGSIDSRTAEITVQRMPEFVSQPQSTMVLPGNSATLTTTVLGIPSPIAQWYEGSVGDTSNPIAGANSFTYTTPSLAADTSYWVAATNVVGTVASDQVVVTVAELPTITDGPASFTISPGESVSLQVEASGIPAPTYQWYVGESGDVSNPIAGAASHTFTSPALSESTNYWVRVSNIAGMVDSITSAVTVQEAPSFVSHPQNQTVSLGSSVMLTAEVRGLPAPTYQWYRGVSGDLSQPLVGEDLAELSIPSVQEDAAYWVRASNSAGTSNSDTATITVRQAPVITTQPVNTTILVGETAGFTVAASGIPAPSYQWFSGMRGDTSTPVVGATGPTLTTPPLSEDGRYWVRVTNVAGTVDSHEALATVHQLPEITSQPQGGTILHGDTFTLSVSASGIPAPTYQWYQGMVGDRSNPIGGASSSTYETPPLTTDTNYWVEATNVVGVVASNQVVVIVEDANADDDNDGLPNDWETEHGLDVSDPADADSDLDGDGYSALVEWALLQDPNRIDDSPMEHAMEGGAEMHLSLSIRKGALKYLGYSIEYSTNEFETWQELQDYGWNRSIEVVDGQTERHQWQDPADFSPAEPLTEQTLVAAQPEENALFGGRVDATDDLVAVGAYGYGNAGVIGKVSVFSNEDNQWELEQTIDDPSGDTQGYFGDSLHLYGDRLMIGKRSDAVYLYKRQSGISPPWTLERTFQIEGGNGLGLDMLGQLSIIGSTDRVELYKHDGADWILSDTVSQTSEGFGFSCALGNGWLAVGASAYEGSQPFVGRVYLYRIDDEGAADERLIIENPEPQALAGFGKRVASDGSHLAVESKGGVYVYKVNLSQTPQFELISQPGLASWHRHLHKGYSGYLLLQSGGNSIGVTGMDSGSPSFLHSPVSQFTAALTNRWMFIGEYLAQESDLTRAGRVRVVPLSNQISEVVRRFYRVRFWKR